MKERWKISRFYFTEKIKHFHWNIFQNFREIFHIIRYLSVRNSTACNSSTMPSWPGFIPIGGTVATSSKFTRNGDNAEIAREIPIFECRMRCSIRSAPTNSSN